jgi:hypothetical protein
MEAIGGPADIGRAIRALEQEVRRDLGQRPLSQGLLRQDDQTTDAPGPAEQCLGDADVGEYGTWRNRLVDQNRVGQVRRKKRRHLRTGDQRIRAQEAVEVGGRQRRARALARRRSQRIDADQPRGGAADAQPSLHDGADQPAGAA